MPSLAGGYWSLLLFRLDLYEKQGQFGSMLPHLSVINLELNTGSKSVFFC